MSFTKMVFWVLSSFVFILFGLLAVAFITLFERKVLGLSQLRLGPNKTSMYGIFQPVLDGLKLLFKKNALLQNKQMSSVLIGPGVVFFLMILLWAILPWSFMFFSLKYSLLMMFGVMGMMSYGVMLVGWGSVSVFSKLGSSRGILQNLAVEICLIIFFFISFCSVDKITLNLDENYSDCFLLWSLSLMVLALVDCNRAPMDLMEGESELISGFNLELGSVVFVFIFLGEYGMMIVFSFLSMNLYHAHKNMMIFSLFSFIFLILRSCFPRVRYEQMMFMMWQEFLLTAILSLGVLICL